MSNIFCNNCGSPIPERGGSIQNFCSVCGKKIQVEFKQEVPAENFNLFTAYMSMLQKYAQFKGRSRRSEYWYATLANSLILFVVYAIIGAIGTYYSSTLSNGAAVILALLSLAVCGYSLAVFIPGVAMCVRRLHDTGKSGGYAFLSLIPYVGWIILIVMLAKDSQPGTNEYGHNPKASPDAEEVFVNEL